MALGKISLDPEDPFDKVLFLEESLHQRGYNAGFESGKNAGKEEGFKVGLLHGKELGKEIGFYKGFVETWKNVLSVKDASKRQISLLESLSQLLDQLNYENPEDEAMEENIAKIRTKFKQLSSILKVPVNIEKDASLMSF